MNRQYFRLSALLLILLLLASCARQPGPISVVPEPTTPEEYADAAEQAFLEGEPATAAELYERAASLSESPAREHRLLRAATLRLEAGDPERADALLAQLPAALPTTLQFHRELVEIHRLLYRDRPAAAYLAFSMLGDVPPELQVETLRLQADVNAAVGNMLESAEAHAALDPLLTTDEARADNQERMWAALTQIPMELLRERMPPAPDAFGGWLELAFVVRSYRLDTAQLEKALAHWKSRYPRHPASVTLLPDLLERYQDQIHRPEQLALLLPLTGSVSGAAEAIRDGFLAAYFNGGNDRPALRIYDVGEDPSNVTNVYRRAVAEGADFVIGPLTKPAVASLAAHSELPVPTLALNTLPDDARAPDQLYQFGLSPEDEARAAADYAVERGYENAIVLVPDSEWGQRVARAFDERFTDRFHRVLDTAYYQADANDFSAPIRQLLNLNASDRRARQVRNTLRVPISFEPRRRQDADFIFIGAFPREARLIPPLLRFHHAIDLPVLATSHVYGGSANPAADRDLNGVLFVDMPWLLDPSSGAEALSRDALEARWRGVAREPRLYALGIDAFQVLPYLQTLRAYPGDRLDGATGVLNVDVDGRIHRNLLPARFRGGIPALEPRALGELAEQAQE